MASNNERRPRRQVNRGPFQHPYSQSNAERPFHGGRRKGTTPSLQTEHSFRDHIPTFQTGHGGRGNVPALETEHGCRDNTPTFQTGHSGRGIVPNFPAGRSGRGNVPNFPAGRGGRGNILTFPAGRGGRGNVPTFRAGRGDRGNVPSFPGERGGKGKDPTFQTGHGGRGKGPSFQTGRGNKGKCPTFQTGHGGRGRGNTPTVLSGQMARFTTETTSSARRPWVQGQFHSQSNLACEYNTNDPNYDYNVGDNIAGEEHYNEVDPYTNIVGEHDPNTEVTEECVEPFIKREYDENVYTSKYGMDDAGHDAPQQEEHFTEYYDEYATTSEALGYNENCSAQSAGVEWEQVPEDHYEDFRTNVGVENWDQEQVEDYGTTVGGESWDQEQVINQYPDQMYRHESQSTKNKFHISSSLGRSSQITEGRKPLLPSPVLPGKALLPSPSPNLKHKGKSRIDQLQKTPLLPDPPNFPEIKIEKSPLAHNIALLPDPVANTSLPSPSASTRKDPLNRPSLKKGLLPDPHTRKTLLPTPITNSDLHEVPSEVDIYSPERRNKGFSQRSKNYTERLKTKAGPHKLVHNQDTAYRRSFDNPEEVIAISSEDDYEHKTSDGIITRNYQIESRFVNNPLSKKIKQEVIAKQEVFEYSHEFDAALDLDVANIVKLEASGNVLRKEKIQSRNKQETGAFLPVKTFDYGYGSVSVDTPIKTEDGSTFMADLKKVEGEVRIPNIDDINKETTNVEKERQAHIERAELIPQRSMNDENGVNIVLTKTLLEMQKTIAKIGKVFKMKGRPPSKSLAAETVKGDADVDMCIKNKTVVEREQEASASDTSVKESGVPKQTDSTVLPVLKPIATRISLKAVSTLDHDTLDSEETSQNKEIENLEKDEVRCNESTEINTESCETVDMEMDAADDDAIETEQIETVAMNEEESGSVNKLQHTNVENLPETSTELPEQRQSNEKEAAGIEDGSLVNAGDFDVSSGGKKEYKTYKEWREAKRAMDMGLSGNNSNVQDSRFTKTRNERYSSNDTHSNRTHGQGNKSNYRSSYGDSRSQGDQRNSKRPHGDRHNERDRRRQSNDYNRDSFDRQHNHEYSRSKSYNRDDNRPDRWEEIAHESSQSRHQSHAKKDSTEVRNKSTTSREAADHKIPTKQSADHDDKHFNAFLEKIKEVAKKAKSSESDSLKLFRTSKKEEKKAKNKAMEKDSTHKPADISSGNKRTAGGPLTSERLEKELKTDFTSDEDIPEESDNMEEMEHDDTLTAEAKVEDKPSLVQKSEKQLDEKSSKLSTSPVLSRKSSTEEPYKLKELRINIKDVTANKDFPQHLKVSLKKPTSTGEKEHLNLAQLNEKVDKGTSIKKVKESLTSSTNESVTELPKDKSVSLKVDMEVPTKVSAVSESEKMFSSDSDDGSPGDYISKLHCFLDNEPNKSAAGSVVDPSIKHLSTSVSSKKENHDKKKSVDSHRSSKRTKHVSHPEFKFAIKPGIKHLKRVDRTWYWKHYLLKFPKIKIKCLGTSDITSLCKTPTVEKIVIHTHSSKFKRIQLFTNSSVISSSSDRESVVCMAQFSRKPKALESDETSDDSEKTQRPIQKKDLEESSDTDMKSPSETDVTLQSSDSESIIDTPSKSKASTSESTVKGPDVSRRNIFSELNMPSTSSEDKEMTDSAASSSNVEKPKLNVRLTNPMEGNLLRQTVSLLKKNIVIPKLKPETLSSGVHEFRGNREKGLTTTDDSSATECSQSTSEQGTRYTNPAPRSKIFSNTQKDDSVSTDSEGFLSLKNRPKLERIDSNATTTSETSVSTNEDLTVEEGVTKVNDSEAKTYKAKEEGKEHGQSMELCMAEAIEGIDVSSAMSELEDALIDFFDDDKNDEMDESGMLDLQRKLDEGKNRRGNDSTDTSDDDMGCSMVPTRIPTQPSSSQGQSSSKKDTMETDTTKNKDNNKSDSMSDCVRRKFKRKPRTAKQCGASVKSKLSKGESTQNEESGEEGDVEDNIQDLSFTVDNEPIEPDNSDCTHVGDKHVTFAGCDQTKLNQSFELINKSNEDEGTEKDGKPEPELTDGLLPSKVEIKEEPDDLKFCYTQEPDTIFLSDDDEMIMSFSQPTISLLSTEDEDEPAKEKHNHKSCLDVKVKREKTEATDDEFADYFSDDWSDKGSDFDPSEFMETLNKRKVQLFSVKEESDSTIDSDKDIFHSPKTLVKDEEDESILPSGQSTLDYNVGSMYASSGESFNDFSSADEELMGKSLADLETQLQEFDAFVKDKKLNKSSESSISDSLLEVEESTSTRMISDDKSTADAKSTSIQIFGKSNKKEKLSKEINVAEKVDDCRPLSVYETATQVNVKQEHTNYLSQSDTQFFGVFDLQTQIDTGNETVEDSDRTMSPDCQTSKNIDDKTELYNVQTQVSAQEQVDDNMFEMQTQIDPYENSQFQDDADDLNDFELSDLENNAETEPDDPQLNTYLTHSQPNNEMSKAKAARLGIKYGSFETEKEDSVYESATQVISSSRRRAVRFSDQIHRVSEPLLGEIGEDTNIHKQRKLAAVDLPPSPKQEDIDLTQRYEDYEEPDSEDAYEMATQVDNIAEEPSRNKAKFDNKSGTGNGESSITADKESAFASRKDTTKTFFRSKASDKKTEAKVKQNSYKEITIPTTHAETSSKESSDLDERYFKATQVENASKDDDVEGDTPDPDFEYNMQTQFDVDIDLDDLAGDDEDPYSAATQVDIPETFVEDNDKSIVGNSKYKPNKTLTQDIYQMATQVDDIDIEPKVEIADHDNKSDTENVKRINKADIQSSFFKGKKKVENSESDEIDILSEEEIYFAATQAQSSSRNPSEIDERYFEATQIDISSNVEEEDDDAQLSLIELDDMIDENEDPYLTATQIDIPEISAAENNINETDVTGKDCPPHKTSAGYSLKSFRNRDDSADDELPVKKSRRTIPEKKTMVTEPLKLKTTAEKRSSGIPLILPETNRKMPERRSSTELKKLFTPDKYAYKPQPGSGDVVELFDASEGDLWLSKKSVVNKSSGSKGKCIKRKRVDDASASIKARMQAAKSQLKERQMQSAVQPSSVPENKRKRHYTGNYLYSVTQHVSIFNFNLNACKSTVSLYRCLS